MANKYNLPDEIVPFYQDMDNLTDLQKWEYQRVKTDVLEDIEARRIDIKSIESEYERILSLIVIIDLIGDVNDEDSKYIDSILKDPLALEIAEKLFNVNEDALKTY